VKVDMSPEGIERRLVEVSALSPLDFRQLPRIDMSPEAIEARLQEWAEMTALCLELSASSPTRTS
jgi:hypothetical protein